MNIKYQTKIFLLKLILISPLVLLPKLSHASTYDDKPSLPAGSLEIIELISKRKMQLNEIPEKYLDNKEFVLELFSTYDDKPSLPAGSLEIIELISKRKMQLNKVPQKYLDNKEFILGLISKDIFAFIEIPKKYYDDFDVMRKAGEYGGTLERVSDRLKDDKELIKTYVSKDGENLQYASDRLKHDSEIIRLSLKSTPTSIEYVPTNLVSREMVIMAITEDKTRASQTYTGIPEKFKSDKEIIKITFKENWKSFEHIPEIIKNDENFVLELIRINPLLLNYDFNLKRSPVFQKKIKEMLDKGEINFDEQSSNRKIVFLNFLYFSEYAKDDGKALYLKLQNGNFTKIDYISPKDEDETVVEVPYFWGYIKDLGFYIVSIQLYEGSYVYLIDDLTGEKLAQIHDYPNISPDRRYLVYAQSCDAFNFSGIQIFEIKPHKVESVYIKDLYGFNFDSWTGNDSFVIKSQFLMNSQEQEYITVYKDSDGWHLKMIKK